MLAYIYQHHGSYRLTTINPCLSFRGALSYVTFFTEKLVGGFNPSEKSESQLGLLFPYIMENKTLFETTNQIIRPY